MFLPVLRQNAIRRGLDPEGLPVHDLRLIQDPVLDAGAPRETVAAAVIVLPDVMARPLRADPVLIQLHRTAGIRIHDPGDVVFILLLKENLLQLLHGNRKLVHSDPNPC